MVSLERCHNIADLRRRARARLPAPMFHYIDGGADDEWSLRNNTSAFDDYLLQPTYLRDVSEIDLSTRVLGQDLALPFFLAPTGMSRLFHHHKELGAARAAERFGTIYSLSTLATTSLEEISATTSGPKMFQIYILRDRELTREFVQRCKQAGYQALCLTVDTPLAGNRERDHVHGMTMPPRITPANFLSYASSFHWLYHLIRDPDFRLANVAHRVDALGKGAMGLIEYVNGQFDRTVCWDDVGWLAQQWDGPLVIKGMTSADDARRALDAGATAAMLSNHGGRQLDGVPAPVDCIAPIRDAVGDRLELIVDGGIRRGTHILKALALGADACSIGRPYLYGLAAAGQAGVERALEILELELARDMALLGCASIADLDAGYVKHRSER
ncbi:alpha-hydroxy-acid oxidizing protein [Pseudohalioglobus sediminis]|uniref:Alpha-hydroxy-acid oxidizing protein n=1 Tax=Pseudohalioglobus sediminis TaxID=2606449 RepID=A0A5B0X4E7_9GAMM|nr:alpha-hydroxy acid oxidase [Pseudohalioglobus sediminis]KAA1194122.1 alpha-hydroxy-acid oxidizing protein [Pseudohalioglobus sediminis]